MLNYDKTNVGRTKISFHFFAKQGKKYVHKFLFSKNRYFFEILSIKKK